MSVIIHGMKMPEHCGYCRFRYDGICHALQKTQYNKEDCPLIPVPPHGRCIDADALTLRVDIHGTNKFGMLDEDIRQFVNAAPTIIPADDKDINVPNKEDGE